MSGTDQSFKCAHDTTMALVSEIEASIGGDAARAAIVGFSALAAANIVLSRHGVSVAAHGDMFNRLWGKVMAQALEGQDNGVQSV
ncbi:MAG: hypothetical protein KDK08_05275 [Rhizobiaceae bacterium]|nr:hypothetical protein [Rhizobiaceae bacterium]MCC0000881.1 hypothetical protein [Methylobacteriaceae bacterium]